MSDAPYPPPPPYGQPVSRPPGNGLAVAALVLGILAMLTAPIPLVNFLGFVLAVVGGGLGFAGIARGRRVGRRTGMAAWGLGLSAVALVVSTVVGFLTVRYLGDLLDTVDPPDPSASIGEEFETDDGDLTITVTSVKCGPPPDSIGPGCTFTFEARNNSEHTLYLDHIKVKAVVDGEWQDPSLDGSTMLVPDETQTITGGVSDYGTLEGLAFDADDASSHSAVVVDVPRAESGQ